MDNSTDDKAQFMVGSVIDYAVFMLNPDGTVGGWNQGAQQLTGYLAEDIVERAFSRFFSDSDQLAGKPQRMLDNAMQNGSDESEEWLCRRDGSTFCAQLIVNTIYDQQNRPTGFSAIAHNRTEQQVQQRKELEQAQYFRLLVEGVTDYAIYMLDPQGGVMSWNAGAQRAKGYLADEIIGQHFSIFYGDREREQHIPERNLATTLEHGRFEDEGWRYRKDGSAFWAHVLIDAIHDDAGKLIGYAKITRDVTERREQQQQLLQAKELAETQSSNMSALSKFLDTVIASIPSGVMVENATTREILLINDRAESLFGVAKSQLLNKRPHECMSPELCDYFSSLTDIALREGGIHQREQQLPTALGERIFNTRATTVAGQDARRNYILLIVEDVTEQRAADARIHHLAHHDTLTSLPNRVLFRQRLNEALRCDPCGRQQIAVLCLDLDKFKNVNDALGHPAGDELLRVVAKRLRAMLRDGDTLARIGGDEFAIVLPAIVSVEQVTTVAERLIEALRPPVKIEGHNLSVGLSVGIALSGAGINTPEQLLRCADMALYEAKRKGRNRCEHFTAEMDHIARSRRVIENDLRDAIGSQQIQLYYQPITDGNAEQSIIGYEALMRWHHPEKGLIMPGDFIPVAEESGLIHMLGAHALYEACREAASWPEKQSVSVNLSPLQFKNSSLVSTVEAALRDSGLEACRLEVEITESVLLDNSLSNIRTLERLKTLGVQIALDDFGTGYSSLSYIRSFPFDKIKIDKSFINDMAESREALAIIRAITGMSRSLNIQITAEGVESIEQFIRLREEGCTLFQGYYFGRPQPSERRLTTLKPTS